MKIEGRNPLMEALKSGRTIDRVIVAKGNMDGSARKLMAMLRDAKIKTQVVDRSILDKESEAGRHQGFIAFVTDYRYATVDDILEVAREREQDPFLMILDGVEDPHNLGSIIRTAECLGVHGIIIPKHRAVSVNDTVMRVAQGAAEYVKIARVTNINQEIEKLKKENIWVIGADAAGEDIRKANLTGAVALVVGGEDTGITPLTRKLCDLVVSIPMVGKINSLNASVAAAVCAFEIAKTR